jgi:uncharacterized protein YdeI (YjbR/CyaY-like superfamily)
MEKMVAKKSYSSTICFFNYLQKNSGIDSVTYDQAVDEALCFGWIDSKINKRDELSFYQYFAVRNPKSNWSKVNKQKVEKLLAENKITKHGLLSIELAKQNGTWNALDEVENLIVPSEMQILLTENKLAQANWDNFSKSSKRAILEWIFNAKTPTTKTKRILETVSKANENKKANHQ